MSDNVPRTRATGSSALIATVHGSEIEITPAPRRFLRLRQVIEATGRSRSSIYEAIKAGTFPPPIPIASASQATARAPIGMGGGKVPSLMAS